MPNSETAEAQEETMRAVKEDSDDEEVIDTVAGGDIDNTLYCICKQVYDGRYAQ